MNAQAQTKTTLVPSATAVAHAADVIAKLETFSTLRINWEGGEYKTANQRLYEILGQCHKTYKEDFLDVEDEDSRRHLRKQIEDTLRSQGVGMQSRTETLTLFVKMVFKSDRKRTHAYAYAIKAAIAAQIPHTQLAAFIEAEGGIEEIRLNAPTSEKAKANQKKRADSVSQIKQEIELAKVNPLATVSCKIDPSTKKVLLEGVVNSNGGIDITCVLQEIPDSFYEQFINQLAKQKIIRQEKLAQANKEAEELQRRIAENSVDAKNFAMPRAA
jgi:hypothetical protein